MSGANLDRAITEMQETGECSVSGLTWADISTVIDQLGLDGRRMIVTGGRLVYLDKSERPPP